MQQPFRTRLKTSLWQPILAIFIVSPFPNMSGRESRIPSIFWPPFSSSPVISPCFMCQLFFMHTKYTMLIDFLLLHFRRQISHVLGNPRLELFSIFFMSGRAIYQHRWPLDASGVCYTSDHKPSRARRTETSPSLPFTMYHRWYTLSTFKGDDPRVGVRLKQIYREARCGRVRERHEMDHELNCWFLYDPCPFF